LGIEVNYTSIKDRSSLRTLLYPMPSLTQLTIRGLRLDDSGRIFPSCPALEKVILDNCIVVSLPDLSAARVVRIDWQTYHHCLRPGGDLRTLKEAIKLEDVGVELKFPNIKLCLPPRLPFLTHLSIRGHWPKDLSIQAPNLNAITLFAHSNGVIRMLCQCDGIPLAQIETLNISIGSMAAGPNDDSIRSLLQRMKGLTSIRAGYIALITIIRLLKDKNVPYNSPRRLLKEKEVVLSNYREEVRIPIGIEERAIVIEGLIKAWNLDLGF
jgi:hypothetical protein